MHQDLNPEQFHSKQGISDEMILFNKNLNSTFGMKKQKPIEAKKPIVSPSHKMNDGLSNVIIDKSLYIQENNYRPGSKR